MYIFNIEFISRIMVNTAQCSVVIDEKSKNETKSFSEVQTKPEKENKEVSDDSKWGYDLYPERRGEKYKPSWTNILFRGEGKETYDKLRCEENVYNCVKNSKCFMITLNSYVVVCQNVARNKGMVQGVLTHEMIHMFDYCRNNLDFKNIDHLACTEIRAANLTHCSFLSAWHQGDASPFRIQSQHQECVKTKAMQSVLAVRNVTEEEARAAVNRVFSRCYDDLEPIGRRLRRNSLDMYKAYMEAPMFGYD
ncbi:hypothetical protein C0J52_19397 [Blattella germanica]|nr:hypothetical protein C0J52_19397 [Blattella germanica]